MLACEQSDCCEDTLDHCYILGDTTLPKYAKCLLIGCSALLYLINLVYHLQIMWDPEKEGCVMY